MNFNTLNNDELKKLFEDVRDELSVRSCTLPDPKVKPEDSINCLQLPIRAVNAANKLGIETIHELIRSKDDLKRIYQCGKATIREIQAALNEVGYKFKEREPKF